MSSISKSTRELYRNIRSELKSAHYRLLLIRQFYTSQETNDLLYKTAPDFFTMLRLDLLNTIVITISRLTDPAKSLNKFDNASLEQLIGSPDLASYPNLVLSLKEILTQIKAKSSRIENWRKKWAAHRDYKVIQGATPMPATSLLEIDEVLTLIGKFANEFESVFQDPHEEINLFGKSQAEVEAMVEIEQLRIKHEEYINVVYHDDGNTIIQLIKLANELKN